MSYDSRLATVHNIIEQHNSNVEENFISFEDFTQKLKNMGGSSEDTLKAISWEDLQECGLPKIMARRVAHIFREESDNVDNNSSYISPKKAYMLSDKDLIKRYDPKDFDSPISKRLNEISNGLPFIVFDDNGNVLLNETEVVLKDIRNGLPPIETYFSGNRPLQVYRVGEKPDSYVNENPIYPGRVLRGGDVCDQTGRSWEGISEDIRKLLYIAINDTKEIKVETVQNANDILDRIVSKNNKFDSLRCLYPKASKRYDELSKIGNLPLMKIKLGKDSKSSNRIF